MSEQQRHAQVKQLFQEVVALPRAERGAFLDEHSPDRQLREEVEALLAHHNTDTILVGETQQAVGTALRNILDRRVAETSGGDLTHLSPQFLAELLLLLRRRLHGLATALLTILVVAMVRTALSSEMTLHWNEEILLLPVFFVWCVLRSRRVLSLWWLRTLENVMMISVCMLILSTDIFELMRGSYESNRAIVVGANASSYLDWTVLILIYGIFVPNTWRRAALILLPVACIPYAIRFAVSAVDPFVNQVLDEMNYVRALPMPFMAALTATYAAHVFYRSRIATVRARRFAQYRLGRLLGRGGMGDVYEAEHSLLKRACAIKLVHSDREFDPATLERFESEVQATARLTHLNTIEVFDYGQTIRGVFYLVMELLPGLNLRQLVEKFGPLPASRACYLLKQLCGALHEAHMHGLIHRDIKPANLFATERGGVYDVAKVTDFGLVRRLDIPADLEPERPHVILGTPLFMAPEQGLGSGHVDARTDIYAMGATAYYLVTGEVPFDCATPGDQLLAHCHQPVPLPSSACPQLPSDVERVILRCLEKNPQSRFQTMDELQAALEACECASDWNAQRARQWWLDRGGMD